MIGLYDVLAIWSRHLDFVVLGILVKARHPLVGITEFKRSPDDMIARDPEYME
jgi:hypothetical protein